MRYLELTEKALKTHSLEGISEDTISKKLHTECSEIIKVYQQTGKYLWRGIHTEESIIKSTIAKNRKPTELKMKIADATNKAISHLGLEAHRGNSIFTTPDKLIAMDWGKAFIVFPHNGFSFTWFQYQPGPYMFYDIQNSYYAAARKFRETVNGSSEELEKFIVTFMADEFKKVYKITNKNLKGALELEHEVLITGDYYYAVSSNLKEKVDEWLNIQRPGKEWHGLPRKQQG